MTRRPPDPAGPATRARTAPADAPASAEQAPPAAGAYVGRTVLGSFRLLRLLGEGSFATAYLAQQLGTERRAVVKIARPELIRGEQGDLYRSFFDAEARAATKVSHPNLVTIYTTGLVDEELPALAMEYVEGKPLGDVLHERAPLPDPALESVFGQLAATLEVLHAAGVIHRDVSPDNIFLGARRGGGVHVTLLDFGVSLREGGAPVVGGAAGTAPYIAPEQFQGQVTSQTDMFSVGVLLWWAVTGQPWLDWMSTDEQLAHLSEMTVAPDPRGVRSEVSGALAVLVRSLLDPDPSLRPSAAQLGERLRAALNPSAEALLPPPLPADALFRPPADLAVPPVTGSQALASTVVAPRREPSGDGPAGAATSLGAQAGPTPPDSPRRRHTSRNRVAAASRPAPQRADPAWKKLRDSRPVSLRGSSSQSATSSLRSGFAESRQPSGPGGPGARTPGSSSLPMGSRRAGTGPNPAAESSGRRARATPLPLGAGRAASSSQLPQGQGSSGQQSGTRLRQDSRPLPVGATRRRSTSDLPMGRGASTSRPPGTRLRQDSQTFGEAQPVTSPGLGSRLRHGHQSFEGPQPVTSPGLPGRASDAPGAPRGARRQTPSAASTAPAGAARSRRAVRAVQVTGAAREALSLAAVRRMVSGLEDLQRSCEVVRAAAIFGGTGEPLAGFSPPDVDLVELSRMVPWASAVGGKLAGGLNGTPLAQTVVRAAPGQVVLTPLPSGRVLCLLTPGDAKVGLALLAAKRAADMLAADAGA